MPGEPTLQCLLELLESAHALPERTFPTINTVFAEGENTVSSFLVVGR